MWKRWLVLPVLRISFFAVTVVRQTILFQARYLLIRRMNALFRITPATPNDLKINRWLPRQWSLQKSGRKREDKVSSPIRIKRGRRASYWKVLPPLSMWSFRIVITKIRTTFPSFHASVWYGNLLLPNSRKRTGSLFTGGWRRVRMPKIFPVVTSVITGGRWYYNRNSSILSRVITLNVAFG